MNFEQARTAWSSVTAMIDDAATHAHRVSRDPLPINTEDVEVMRRRLDVVVRRLEQMLLGLGG